MHPVGAPAQDPSGRRPSPVVVFLVAMLGPPLSRFPGATFSKSTIIQILADEGLSNLHPKTLHAHDVVDNRIKGGGSSDAPPHASQADPRRG